MGQATLSERPYVNSNLFSGHYLDERIQERDEWKCDEVAREAMDDLQSLYELEGNLVSSYGEDALIDNWIDEVLDVLGFGTQVEVTLPNGGGYVDGLLFETPTTRREAAKVYLETNDTTDLFERGLGILEAKQWDAAFDVQFSEQRPYRNASHQTKHYLENTPPNIQWGVLTNGRKWRLYGTNDYETQTYYEVDLPELLERGDLEAFKYFYVFFRPGAFHESGGTTFLDEVWSESETASQELGESLQNNVFTALRVLGRGFVESNDALDIDPDDEEALDELKEQSLVFLYRLMFVLYAESRGLIHPQNQSAQDEYEQNFSLDELRLEIHDAIGEVDEEFDDEFSDYSTTMWNRLEDLFRLIDEGEEKLGIPPYNGGLFDHDAHDFLTEHEVSNQYLAEVIYRLSTTQNDEGRYVLADYADLDTRHLGSVYEGLLEHQFRIAPEQYAAVSEDGSQVWKAATEVSVADAVETVPEGGLYVVNDEGERKATGAYYTPDYVVTYIVEETVGPLVEEIREDLIDQGFEPGTQEYIGPFFRRVTDLRILDPAMGSGHFLTKATGYLSEQVMAEVREAEEEFGVAFNEQHVRREIAKECIYGVDLNGMAVELAKLSMWLETLAADRPLAFLDHHFKQGNSLVGSDIEAIEELESDANGDDEQASLAEFGATREGTIERLMDIYGDFLAIENETVEDVHEMKRKYAEIEQNELRNRLVTMANVHTAEAYGVDVPSGAYERMAKALEDDEIAWAKVQDTDWCRRAQTLAEEKNALHWKLEFPEVFYDEDGGDVDAPGFDVVLGNPPYVRIYRGSLPEDDVKYWRDRFDTAHMKFDLYTVFMELSIDLTRKNGNMSMIVPDAWMSTPYGEPLRNKIVDETYIKSILDLRDRSVFSGVTVSNVIPIFCRGDHGDASFPVLTMHDESGEVEANNHLSEDIIRSTEDNSLRLSMSAEDVLLTNRIEERSVRFDDIYYANWGLRTGTKEKTKKYVVESPPNPEEVDAPIHEMIRGQDIVDRYKLAESSEYIVYQKDGLYNPMFEELFESDKLVFRKISGEGLMAVVDENARYCFSTLIPATNISNVAHVDRSGIPDETDSCHRYTDPYYALALVNSTLMDWYYQTNLSDDLSVVPGHIQQLPIAEIDFDNDDQTTAYEAIEMYESGVIEEAHGELLENVRKQIGAGNGPVIHDLLSRTARRMTKCNEELVALNLDLLDYLKPYSEGPTITEIGTYQPPSGVGDTKLATTADDYENLRVGTVTVEHEDEFTVTIHATARYKPDKDTHETDRWGYTETEPMPAMRLTDLSKTEADLVEAFVPVAVEEAGGFAGFRETATKTNSLVDRLEAMTLPDPDDVADDVERYREAVERAEGLDEKIRRTDDLIDEIVYDLYELTDEEIEIVEEALD